MKRQILSAILIFLPIASVLPQKKVDIFGYFESQLMGARVRTDFIHMQSNKLRIDLESKWSEHVSFGANFDYITYHGKTRWAILDYLPETVTAVVPEDMRSLYVLPFDDRHFLDNAYLKLTIKYFDLTVGNQPISLGSGYAWNPTDLFNTQDLLDPTYEQPGHNAIRLDVPIGTRYSLTALYAPGEGWEDSGKLLQFKGRISHFDYHLIAVEKTWRFHDYTQFNLDPLNPGFLELPEKRRMLGFSTAGELFGLGIWSECGYNWMETSDDFYEIVLGTDYTFDSGTYIVAEFYRNTLGKPDEGDYTLNDWMRYLVQEQKTISRDQAYAIIQHPFTDLLTLGISTIYTFSDGSFALLPTLNYSPFENVEILTYINYYHGNHLAAFNKNLGNGGMIRARVYF
ncbi:MAG: hypothetical protein ABIL68_04745 [bacterium]